MLFVSGTDSRHIDAKPLLSSPDAFFLSFSVADIVAFSCAELASQVVAQIWVA